MMIMTMITLKMEIYVCLSVGLLFEHRQYKEQRAHTSTLSINYNGNRVDLRENTNSNNNKISNDCHGAYQNQKTFELQ